MAAVMDKKTILRDKRAQGIAAMGLVAREGDRFRVQTPSLRGRRTNYEVWRDEGGRVRCTCLEFEEHEATDPSFRCEHILAVKHSLVAKSSDDVKTSEAATKQQTSSPAPRETTPAAEMIETKETKRAATVSLNINARASEKPAAGNRPLAAVADEAARFGRERNEVASTDFAATTVSLAQEGDKKK